MKKSCMIALLVLTAATGVQASAKDKDEGTSTETSQAGTTDAVDPAQAAKEKVICKTERVTGSLARSNRVCMTKQQWDELYAATRKKVDDFQSNGTMRRDGQTNGNGN